MVAVTHKTVNVWCHISVRVILCFEDDTNKNHYGAKFSTTVSVLHQFSWKFCKHLYLGFAGLKPEHHPFHAMVFIFLFAYGKESVSDSSIRCQAFFNVKFYEVQIFLLFHHFSPTFSIVETTKGTHVGIFLTCKHVRHFDNPTILPPSTLT